jgi:HEAT repeat protein
MTVSCLVLLGPVPIHSAGVETPWIMYEDPVLKKPVVETTFPPELIDRWLQALARSEREMKRRAALAIADAAARGTPGLDVTVDALCEVLRTPGQDRIVRLTTARALVALDARQAVPLLAESTGPEDLEMAEVVEPALARWKETALRERWMERLSADDGRLRLRVLAIRGLTALGETDTLPRLRELAIDRNTPTAVRLEAADALGVMQETGLVDAARQLSNDQSAAAVVDRLVAARMLAGHGGDDAVELLVELATDHQPSVGTIALACLFRIDPSLMLPVIDATVSSRDANVRRWGAEALAARPSRELLAVLAPMLDDRDPAIRRYVCDSLVTLAKDSALRETVTDEGRRVLNGEGWRGQEQAALLLVAMEETTIVSRLIELLDVSRPEANVAAAWGLCQLAVPETAEPVLAVVQRKTESWLAREPQNPGIDDQLALLCQMLGVLKYSPADGVMRKFIPKGSGLGETCRAAAIWTLGHLHADQVDERLAGELEKRLLDAFNEMEPESWLVCRMAAVTLGRMKATKNLPALQTVLNQASLTSDLGYASAWAIWRLTGEEIPPLSPIIDPDLDWFLIPSER